MLDPGGAEHRVHSANRSSSHADGDLESFADRWAAATDNGERDRLLAGALESGLIADAAVAQTQTQMKAFWHIREGHSAGQKPEGAVWKHDVSVPVSKIPDFIGQLRLMAVAYDKTRVGSSDARLFVRDAVAADVILPRFLSPGDESRVALSLHNVDGAPGDYQVKLESSGAVALDRPFAETKRLAANQRDLLAVPINAGEVGLATVSVAVEGPGGFLQAACGFIQPGVGWWEPFSWVRPRTEEIVPRPRGRDGSQPWRGAG